MKTYQFTTNLTDNESLEKIKTHFAGSNGIIDWHADLDKPGKILTVKAESLTVDEISTIIFNAGFRNRPVSSGWKRVIKKMFTKDCCS